jgi:hypothetical protein
MKYGKLKPYMRHSENGVKHLAGREVEVLCIDEGESWEPTIARVRSGNETVWVNAQDLILSDNTE